MDDEEFYKERDELLDRFRQSLVLPLSERFFDEMELVDIFDYAGDEKDTYICLEVLMVAARFYPDSELLNQRRAIIYGQLSDSAGREFVADRVDSNGPMWDILRLRENIPSDPETLDQELDKIVESVKLFDEEEIVQILMLASDARLLDWIKKNYNRLRRRTDNEKMLMYEYAIIYEQHNRPAEAAEFLEKLTEIDPFNAANWFVLAHQYSSLGNEEKFKSAIEYALALDPDNWEGLEIQARFLINSGAPIEEATAVLEHCVKCHPTTVDPFRLLAYCYRRLGRDKEAESIYRRLLKDFPADATVVIPELVTMACSDTEDLLRQLYRINPDNSELFWRTWADTKWQIGETELAFKIISCYENESHSAHGSLVPAQWYAMQSGCEQEALESLEAYRTWRTETGEFVDYSVYYVLKATILAALHRRVDALEACREFDRFVESASLMSITDRLAFYGAGAYIADLKSRLEA